MADMIVSGAEYSAANGTYVESGTFGGRPTYIHESNVDWLLRYEDDSAWVMYDSIEYDFYYTSFDNVATPDLCSDWMDFLAGESSSLTVTAASSGQNLTLTCAAGSYTLTGTNVTLTHTPASQNLTLACNAGSYSLTGTNADLTVTRHYTLT